MRLLETDGRAREIFVEADDSVDEWTYACTYIFVEQESKQEVHSDCSIRAQLRVPSVTWTWT